MIKDNIKEYEFSVIVPIYNTDKYLEETIDSVINQTIGFKSNIQLILVNNASEDNCYDICRKYVAKYPDNIEYIELVENRGPSGARNIGLEKVNIPDRGNRGSRMLGTNIPEYGNRPVTQLMIYQDRILHA